MSAAALIVAGGASRRMGRDKLTLPLSARSHQTVLDAVLDAVNSVAERLVVLLPPEPSADVLRVVESHKGAIAATDPSWHAGPLAALASAWRHVTGCGEVFVAAGDLPGLRADVLSVCHSVLLAAGENCDGAVVVREGRLQPLLACYRHRAGQAFIDVATEGEARLQPALDRLRLARVEAEAMCWPKWSVRPVHTPEDYDEWLLDTQKGEGGGVDEST